ncbi:hypothetical protein Q6288_26585, partial [Klebsiella quasipneumoniae]|uniref:hypothetical protein n=1 Tax=Klebsiella quasipneumoniae TaxID=1463165 RepID=UPI00272FF652
QAEFFFFKDRMKLKKKGSDSLGNLHICSLHDENHGTGSDFSSVQSLSHVQLFATLRTVACQAPLSIGILQASILEWVAKSFSRGSSQPRDQTQVSCIAGRFFTTESPCKPSIIVNISVNDIQSF